MTTRVGFCNARVSGSMDPFRKDAINEIKPAMDGWSRKSSGPMPNPLYTRLDGTADAKDMLRWAIILAADSSGLPAVVVAFLAYVFYYSTRKPAVWCSAHAKKFSANVSEAMECVFPNFGNAITLRATKNPEPWALQRHHLNTNNRAPKSISLAGILGRKRPVPLPAKKDYIVMFAEITEYATMEFKNYLQNLVGNAGFAESLGYACVTNVKSWFSDPTASPKKVNSLRAAAARAGMEIVLQPLLGLQHRRQLSVSFWPPILLARAPPSCKERESNFLRAAQLCRATISSRLSRVSMLTPVMEHSVRRVCEFGFAYYGANRHASLMWMSRTPGMTTVGLSETGCMFQVLAKQIVVTTACITVLRMLEAKRLKIDLFPAASRLAAVKAQKAKVPAFTKEWQTPTMLPFVVDGEVRVNNAESVGWEFLDLAIYRGANKIQMIGMTSKAMPMWRALIANEFKPMVGDQVTVHSDLLDPAVLSEHDVHDAVRIEHSDITATGFVKPETIPVICAKCKTAKPCRPRHIATAAEMTAAYAAEKLSPSGPVAFVDELSDSGSKRPCESQAVFDAENAAKRWRGDE